MGSETLATGQGGLSVGTSVGTAAPDGIGLPLPRPRPDRVAHVTRSPLQLPLGSCPKASRGPFATEALR